MARINRQVHIKAEMGSSGENKPSKPPASPKEQKFHDHAQATQDRVGEIVEASDADDKAGNSSIKETRGTETSLNPEIDRSENERVSLASEELPASEDARSLIPTTEDEADALSRAITPTSLQYVGITGRAWDLSPRYASYFSQWYFYQQRMNKYWLEGGFLSVPPRLVSLDRWEGGVGNWKSARMLHGGTRAEGE
ncbi:hypothetical protein MMC07_000954 [Pseudocyphellaria aurata]|nr:hypothetical protein [Pseudocyphellaria aurata]